MIGYLQLQRDSSNLQLIDIKRMCKFVYRVIIAFRPVMYETLKSTVNLEHSPSISKIIMRQNKLTDI